MKWLYIIIGFIIFLFVWGLMEKYENVNTSSMEVIRSGVQP